MQQIYKNLFPDLPGHCRVWVYTSNRIISAIESEEILKEIKSFVGSWKTHQKSLNADGTILLDRCLVFAVDEEIQSISGCSIDSSVKLVKSIGQKYNIDFFNRLNMLLLKDEHPIMVSYHDLNNYKDHNIFNPNVETLAKMRSEWLVPVLDSTFI